MIKILIAPNFEQDDENDQPKDVMELELVGHKAIVRTVCFNPVDPNSLWSSFKIWIVGVNLGCNDLEMNSQPSEVILQSSNSKNSTGFPISRN